MALTPKQEAFAQAIISGVSQADAYRAAYSAEGMKPETVQKRASELMRNGEVAGRVEQLRRPIVESLQYGLKEAMLEAEEALKVSRERGNGGAMVAAVTLRAKLFGLLVEKREIKLGPLDSVPADELKALEDALTALGSTAGTTASGAGRTTH